MKLNAIEGMVISHVLPGIGPMLAEAYHAFLDPANGAPVMLLVRDEVNKLEGHPELTNQQKHDAAKAAVTAELKSLGIELAGFMVNLLLEVAVAYLQSQAAAKSKPAS